MGHEEVGGWITARAIAKITQDNGKVATSRRDVGN